MCGQFDALLDMNALRVFFDLLQPAPGGGQILTVAPTLAAPILVQNAEDGAFGVLPARFGLVPHWYKGALRDWKATTFNARLEDAATKPTFKGAWRYRRCVVPAEAFYEWSGPKSDRQKWRITRGDNQPLAFAGLWDEAPTDQGDVFSFAILTRPAGSDMQAIHDREPVILPPDAWEPWMQRRPVDLTLSSPLKLQNLTAQASLL